MAVEATNELLQPLIEAELTELEKKRMLSGDMWEPVDGAGIMPEDEWNKFSPFSNPQTDTSKIEIGGTIV